MADCLVVSLEGHKGLVRDAMLLGNGCQGAMLGCLQSSMIESWLVTRMSQLSMWLSIDEAEQLSFSCSPTVVSRQHVGFRARWLT